MLLDVRSLSVAYKQLRVVHGVSMQVDESTIVGVIGANGAGKSTVLKTISGLLRPVSGEIFLDGTRIDHCDVTEIVRRGVAHCPERRRLFPYMSVGDNVRLGAYLQNDKAAIQRMFDEVYRRFPILGKRITQKAGSLSGGEQQMVAIARALMARPKVLLLDEPTLGLAPLMIGELANVVKDIRNEGISVVLVEQNVQMALSVADYAYLLSQGHVVLEGPPKDFLENDYVRRTFLGE